jgi:NAD(P)H-dependent FMN reductase
MTVRLLAFAASLRKASLNRRLLGAAVEFARQQGATVDLADFHEFDMPLYDADLQARDGVPPGALQLGHRVAAVDGLVIASPEYSHSMPGILKNALDWVARLKTAPLQGKSALLLSTSTTLVGGNRGLWALRVPLEVLGVFVYPEMYSLATGDKALDAEDWPSDPAARQRLEKLVAAYLETAARLRG